MYNTSKGLMIEMNVKRCDKAADPPFPVSRARIPGSARAPVANEAPARELCLLDGERTAASTTAGRVWIVEGKS